MAIRRRSMAGLFGLLVGSVSAGLAGPIPKIAPEAIEWRPASIFEKDAKGDKLKDQPRMNL
ncbi:MAG: hypothetical protein JWQ17_680, partial [Tardiphaga sp.]|nr:hypothetical protein [Tardiphaga sp.]